MKLSMRAGAAMAVAVATVTAGIAAPALASSRPVHSTSTPSYYVALGDSLSQGVQENSSGASVITNEGYVDDIYAALSVSTPGLQLVKLGCPGETTGTMLYGGICSYPGFTPGSQERAAVAFLRHHAGDKVLVTLDIGANNVDGCVSAAGFNTTCIAKGVAKAKVQLPHILKDLRNADPNAEIVAMNYYDPFLADYLTGPTGQNLAEVSESIAVQYNGLLDTIYGAFSVPVVDIQDNPFQTTNFNPGPGTGGEPTNVVGICLLTYMCPPVSGDPYPNIHMNATGYYLTAQQFLATITGF